MLAVPEHLPEHSPVGASGAHRWMVCPHSVKLAEGIRDEESEHAALGTRAHELAEWCLTGRWDAWEFTGAMEGKVNKDLVDPVQLYVDAVAEAHPERHKTNSFVELEFYCPALHPFFYGKADFVYVSHTNRVLHVWDYKHGAGIVVEVDENPQLMYYGTGVLESLGLWGDIDDVVLHVAQPRGFHPQGILRQWSVSTADLRDWARTTLIPAMRNAFVSKETRSGEHCRFCPARFAACPQLLADMEELEGMIKMIEKKEGGAQELTNEQVARYLELFEIAKIVSKAASQTAFQRLNAGHTIPGFKLGQAKANREWKPGAELELKNKFGKKAYTLPVLKSPAQIETLAGGEALTARWAFKPNAGLTVIRSTDPRPAINKDVKSLFEPVKKAKGAK